MGLGHSPSIVVDGLVFMIDPNNTNCYSGFGNTVYNLVNPSIGGTFVGYTSNPIDNTENRTIAFDGSTNFIQTNYYPFFSSDFTIEVFVKFTRYNNYQCVLSSMNNGSAVNGFWFEFGSDRGFTIYTTGSQLVLEDNIVSLTNLDLNKWHHLVATRSGTGTSNVKLYVNNVLCGQNSSNAAIGHSSYAMMIGKYDYVGNYSFFKGNVGIVRMYNKGFRADEILQNYNATKKKYDPDENIVTNGLVLHIDPSKNTSYPGTGNTIYDLSGFGNTGTLTNGPVLSSSNGGVIVLDGTNDYISFNNAYASGFGISANATISIWAKITDENYYQPFVGFYNPTAGNRSDFGIDIASNDTERIWKNDSAGGGSYLFKFGRWDNYVLTSDTSTAKMYVNGELKSTLNSSGGINNNRMFVIGYNWDGMSNASISQTLLYNKTLTQQEILQNYNATKNRFVNALPPVRNGLVLELDAANRDSYSGTGNTWYDLSGNNLNGTLTNGPTFSGIGATSSLVFDRSNDYVAVADNSLLNTFTNMTLEVIVRYTTTNSQIFAQKWNYTLGNDGYTLEILNSAIVAACYSAGSSYLSVSISGYPINNTYHMIFTLSGSTQTLYINGVSVATNSGGSVPNISGTNFTIGNRSNLTGTYFGGNVYLTKFYNRALSAYEIKQNFDFYRTRYNI